MFTSVLHALVFASQIQGRTKPEPSLPKHNIIITIDITTDVTIDITIDAGIQFVTGEFQNPPVTFPKVIAL